MQPSFPRLTEEGVGNLYKRCVRGNKKGLTLNANPSKFTRYSLLATRYSLLATRYSLLATRYSLLATRYSLSTDLPTNHRYPTCLVRQRCCSLRLPIHRNQSSDIACCKTGGAGFVRPIQRQHYIEGI